MGWVKFFQTYQAFYSSVGKKKWLTQCSESQNKKPTTKQGHFLIKVMKPKKQNIMGGSISCRQNKALC